MKSTLIKQTRFNIAKNILTLIGFIVLLAILALGSCAKKTGSDPQPDYMSFALTNLGGGPPVDPTTPLSRGDTYRLTITPTNGTTIPTADYTITHIPTAALTINVTRTNSVDFTVNNTADTTVTVTVTHKTDSSVSESVTLRLAPLAVDYMSFALTNRSGAIVDPTTQLSRGSTYGLVITPGSGVVPETADYVVTHTPVAAITTNVIRTNSVDFTVNNTADTTVTITVTHRTDSSISESITLNLDVAPQAPNMIFALTNLAGGPLVDPTTRLARGSTYGLVITPGSGVVPATADYTITYTPDAIIINVTRTNSVDFTVDNTADTTITFTVTHRTASAISETLTLNLASQATTTSFQQDVENATTVPNLILANVLTREVLSPLGSIRGGATLEKRYVTESGGGTQSGTSWATAWAGTSLRNNINAISDATANKVYLVMVAGGTYKPGINRGDSFSMRNYIAIMGGFQTGGGWGRTGTTVFSGDIGTIGTTTDNSYHVFNNSGTLNNAHLYGVTITGGNANHSTSAAQQLGGGMYNFTSSPVLTRVVFNGNNALSQGGGMYNSRSSSVLTHVVFSGNTATSDGGGMANWGSFPVLTEVVFSGNTATSDGGGMYNTTSSSPVLTSVVFSGNTASGNGGGMANWNSSPVLIGAVFRNNRAANGGGMEDDNGTAAGPLIVNTIFSGNTATGSGPDIAVDISGASTKNIRITGSVLGIGQSSAIAGIIGYRGSATLNITYHSLVNSAVRFGADATTGLLTYPTIQTGSSAINLGLYVRRNGGTYYFSEDRGTWYTGFSATGGLVTIDNPPANATDLTATDIAGNARNGRPDAGVRERP